MSHGPKLSPVNPQYSFCRRYFLALAGAGIVSPRISLAQRTGGPVIGFLNGGSPYEWAPFVAAFREGLSEMGYAEGRNAAIEFRWAFGDGEQIPALARDLVDRRVDVIVTSAGNQPTVAAKRATTEIPIVATFGNDPIRAGIIPSLDKPGGNVTGISLIAETLESKQLELLREIAPKDSTVGFLLDPLPGIVDARPYQDAARQVGVQLATVQASTDAEIDAAFASLVQQRVRALVVASTAYFLGRRDRLAGLAARHSIATMYPARPYVESGGLISYGVDRTEIYHQLGLLVGRILRGDAVPALTPVRRPTKFELAINLKTAKGMGIAIPQTLLTLASTVIS